MIGPFPDNDMQTPHPLPKIGFLAQKVAQYSETNVNNFCDTVIFVLKILGIF